MAVSGTPRQVPHGLPHPGRFNSPFVADCVRSSVPGAVSNGPCGMCSAVATAKPSAVYPMDAVVAMPSRHQSAAHPYDAWLCPSSPNVHLEPHPAAQSYVDLLVADYVRLAEPAANGRSSQREAISQDILPFRRSSLARLHRAAELAFRRASRGWLLAACDRPASSRRTSFAMGRSDAARQQRQRLDDPVIIAPACRLPGGKVGWRTMCEAVVPTLHRAERSGASGWP